MCVYVTFAADCFDVLLTSCSLQQAAVITQHTLPDLPYPAELLHTEIASKQLALVMPVVLCSQQTV